MTEKIHLKNPDQLKRISGIIGTAGHIDHGKTALVKALTGIDTDRLLEEKKRSISIDIGFAHIDFENKGETLRAAIVDVPGHERFIKNMLVGATGFSVVMFVIAADDGIMPQTIEHFRIVRLLGVKEAVFVITKIDLVDKLRLDAVKKEIAGLIEKTAYKDAQICAVSSISREGIDNLRSILMGFILNSAPKRIDRFFRLPIDRVFAVKGFGTVVTGTIASGEIAKGGDAVCMPLRRSVKVRGIQSLYLNADTIASGDRAALNLGGVSHTELKRGDMLIDARIAQIYSSSDHAGYYIDASVEFVVEKGPYMKSDRRSFKMHYLSTDALAAARFSDITNEKGAHFCRMALPRPLFAASGDRFIIRDSAINETIGGGTVILPYLTRRDMPPFAKAAQLLNIKIESILPAYLELRGFIATQAASAMLNAPIETLIEEANALQAAQIIRIGDYITISDSLGRLEEIIVGIIKRESLRNANIDEQTLFNLVRMNVDYPVTIEYFCLVLNRLCERNVIKKDGQRYLLNNMPRVEVEASDAQKAVLKLLPTGYNGLNIDDLKKLGLSKTELEKTIASLVKSGLLVRLTETTIISSESVDKARHSLENFFKTHEYIKASEFRDMLGCGRKLAIAIVEHFDKMKITLRKGDLRMRR